MLPKHISLPVAQSQEDDDAALSGIHGPPYGLELLLNVATSQTSLSKPDARRVDDGFAAFPLLWLAIGVFVLLAAVSVLALVSMLRIDRSPRIETTVMVALGATVTLILLIAALLWRHLRARYAANVRARNAYALLRTTMANLSEGIVVFAHDRRLLAWNSRYAELREIDATQLELGADAEGILRLGTPVSTWNAGELVPLEGSRAEFITEQRPFDVDVVQNNGLVLHVSGRPMADGNYLFTYSDVTALKSSEQAYRDQATRLAATLDNIFDGIITIDESGSIESWSKGAQRLFGYTEAEIVRRNVATLLPRDAGRDTFLQRDNSGRSRILGERRELEGVRKDGTKIPIDLVVSELCISRRRLFIAVVRDIADRYAVERMKSGFVSTVSHELRTPLTSISGSLGLLMGGAVGELHGKARRLVEIAKLNSDRLVRLINDILDIEKAESGKLSLHLEPVMLRQLIEHAVDLNRAYADSLGVHIALDPASADVKVNVDRDRLAQVMTNLLSNAAKFSPPGGTVSTRIVTEGDVVQVSVRDEGEGIPAEFQAQIFQKFARADNSDARRKGGTGLGLSISKTIIERLGGEIGFTSAMGDGTEFFITLPIVRDIAGDTTIITGALRGPAVLLCEDDPDIATVLVEMLQQEGMRVAVVGNARAALAALRAFRYHVAIIDLNLPDMDGLELITRLRNDESTRHLAIVVATARPTDERVGDSLIASLQLADWMQKPIDPQRLLATIHSVLAAPLDRRARILHVEDDASLTELVHELLGSQADVTSAFTLSQAREFAGNDYDLVILDIGLGEDSGLEVLPLLKTGGKNPPVILYSATEPSREVSAQVQAALVKSRDSVEQLLASVRDLTRGVYQ